MLLLINKYLKPIVLLSGILFVGITTNKSVSQNKEDKIQKTILNELTIHPKATLIDIYKNFFQGAFGPAHMINNPQSVIEYIKEELQDNSPYDSVLWQKVGFDNRFVRVNLSLIKDSTISLEKLADAFIKTAKHRKQPSLNSWKKEWQLIIKVLNQMNISVANFEADKIYLQNMLNKRKMVIHHSKIFIKEYNPHYRIISTEYVNEIKLRK